MIRVAEVVYEPAHSGQSAHVLSLAEHLDPDHFSICVCYRGGDARMRERLTKLDVEGHAWPIRRWFNAGPAWALYRLVRREKIDIVHVHGQFAGLWARPAARLAGAQVIYTPQTIRIRQRWMQPMYHMAEKALGKLTHGTISVCGADRCRLIEWGWGSAEQIVVIPNGIDWEWWHFRRQEKAAARQILGWNAEQPVVLQVGRLNEQKAPKTIIDVASLVVPERPDVHFYLAGDGPLREQVMKKIRSLGLETSVTLLGRREDVPALLSAADVVTLSSLWEGMPYTLLEAGAMGRPAVCTAVDGSPEVVIDGETGYVVPPANPPAMADAIRRLLDNPDLAEEMGRRASGRVRTTFDVRKMAKDVGNLYMQVTTGERPALVEDSPAMRDFTTPRNPAADETIVGHMRQIRDAILDARSRNISSIVLTGGFGRGEGGVVADAAGNYVPVNDYDILVITRREGLLPRLWLRRRLKALEPDLTRRCGVRVDIACRTPRMLLDAPNTVDAYETAVGHKLIWGTEEALERIRRRDATALPLYEASRYLFNRGAALLWARQMVFTQPSLDEDHWRFLLIAIQKARLAWGDALLLANHSYIAHYSERQGQLQSVKLPDDLAFLEDAYRDALRFKLRPEFERYRAVEMAGWLQETIGRHERVWRWIETQRGMKHQERDAFWMAFYRHLAPRLRDAGAPLNLSARLYNLGLNIWRTRPFTVRWLFEHPDERLVRTLPLLLFVDNDALLPWSAMGALLGVGRRALTNDPRIYLSDRFIAVWHPGPPF